MRANTHFFSAAADGLTPARYRQAIKLLSLGAAALVLVGCIFETSELGSFDSKDPYTEAQRGAIDNCSIWQNAAPAAAATVCRKDCRRKSPAPVRVNSPLPGNSNTNQNSISE